MAAEAEAAPVTRVALVEDDREARARIAASIRLQNSLELVAEYATGAEAHRRRVRSGGTGWNFDLSETETRA